MRLLWYWVHIEQTSHCLSYFERIYSSAPVWYQGKILMCRNRRETREKAGSIIISVTDFGKKCGIFYVIVEMYFCLEWL